MTDLRPLPDILKKDLKILFVGHSPGVRSSDIGHYFAGNSNVFWKLLYESGLTKSQLRFTDDRRLLHYGYGLTDIVKRPTRSIGETKQHYTIKNTKRINRVLTMLTPKIVAFVGKAGFRIYNQNRSSKLSYGFQYKYRNVRLYLVPSTSGQSYNDTKYEEKLYWYSALKLYSDRIRSDYC